MLHKLNIREILHTQIYKDKLLDNCLRNQWGLNCNLRCIRSQEIRKFHWIEMKRWNWCLVSSVLAWNVIFILLVFSKNRKNVMLNLISSFLILLPDHLPFFKIEIAGNLHSHFSCCLLILGKTKVFSKQDCKCSSLLKFVYAF